MCSGTFEDFRSEADLRGKDAAIQVERFLLQRRRGQPLGSSRVALELGLDPDDVEDLFEIACGESVGLMERADVVKCPHGDCGAMELVDSLVEQEQSEGEARCSVCDEVIADPASLSSERRYQLTVSGDKEANAAQAAEAAMPQLTAALLTALP